MKIKLSRKKSNSELLVRNLTTSLVLHESITVTVTKARALKSFFDILITHTIKGDLDAKRYAAKVLLDNNACIKLFNEILPRLQNKTGNVSVVKLNNRLGDNAPMAKVSVILKPLEKKAVIDEEIKTKKIDSSKVTKEND